MKNIKKNKKKVFGSLALVFLALSAGLFPLSVVDAKDGRSHDQLVTSFKKLSQSGELNSLQRIDFIEELNNRYSVNGVGEFYFPGVALEEAIREGDYDSYIEAIKEMEGFPEGVGIIDKRDFDILVQLKKLNSENSLQEEDSI